MIHVLASIQVKPGKRNTFLEIFKTNVPNVLQEEGCVEYSPAVDIDAGLPPDDVRHEHGRPLCRTRRQLPGAEHRRE